MEEENINLENSGEETDYKAMYEAEKERADKAQEGYDKYKWMFKSEKAKQWKSEWLDQDTIQQMVEKSVSAVQFYSNKANATEHKEKIEELVATGLSRDRAYTLVMAETDVTQLLDDQKKAQLNGNTSLNWVPNYQGDKSSKDLSGQEINNMSDADFDKLMDGVTPWVKRFVGDSK